MVIPRLLCEQGSYLRLLKQHTTTVFKPNKVAHQKICSVLSLSYQAKQILVYDNSKRVEFWRNNYFTFLSLDLNLIGRKAIRKKIKMKYVWLTVPKRYARIFRKSPHLPLKYSKNFSRDKNLLRTCSKTPPKD